MEHSPKNPAVIGAIKIGQNVIDYATGREMPADKLVAPRGPQLQGRAAQAGAPCGSPSSCTPATGTSRPRRSPT